MNALCKEKKGPGHLRLVDLAVPAPGSGQVQITVQAAGICGTDIHIKHDTFPYAPPVVLGHEFSGTISALGAGVDHWRVGDRVIAETTVTYCGQCPFCHRGETNLCPQRKAYGIHVNGGFAEVVVVRAGAVHRLPPHVDFVAAALTEPLAVCVHAMIEKNRLFTGQLVLITGPGPIGLLAALLAKAHGTTVVVAGTSRDANRLSLAATLGVDLTVTVDKTNLRDAIAGLVGANGGVDLTVEASGSAAAVETAFACTRKGGVIIQLGLFDGPIRIDYSQVAFRELTISGSFAHCWTSFERALDLMETGRVNVKPLVSGILPLTEWEQAFEQAENGQAAKILLAPGPIPT